MQAVLQASGKAAAEVEPKGKRIIPERARSLEIACYR